MMSWGMGWKDGGGGGDGGFRWDGDTETGVVLGALEHLLAKKPTANNTTISPLAVAMIPTGFMMSPRPHKLEKVLC